MNIFLSSKREALRLGRLINPIAWVWATVIAAAVISAALFWNQARQRRVIDHFTREQVIVRQARQDLSNGYLHVTLAGRPQSPFDRGQGLALIGQAGANLERALGLKHEFGDADEASHSQLALFRRAVEDFRAQVIGRGDVSAPDQASEAGLRIAFFALEQKANAVDVLIQQDLSRMMRGYDRFHATVLWSSAVLLLFICLAVYAGDRARKLAEKALRANEEIYRLIVTNSGEAILFTNPDGSVYSANPAASRIFGRTEEEIRRVGRQGIVDFDDPRLPAALEERRRTGSFDGELNMLRSDGTKFQAEISTAVFRDSLGSERASLIIRDITERKRADEAIRASLREKDVLLREIHHRVKNNMQVISSLFSLQAAHITNEECRSILKEGQARIRSMSLVHEKLYQSRDLSKIDFGGYIRSLASQLFNGYLDRPDRVRLETEFEEISLDINSAVPCGLILNELISNALKHAFPEGRAGTIRIELRRGPAGSVVLRVADDGGGLPEGFDVRGAGSFGLQIVNLLVDQLDAKLDVDGTRGTAFTMTFGEGKYPPRI